jgi:DNA-binding GntR family transcriptional regulator
MLRRKVPVPLYHQLELALRAAIEDGRFKPGDQLPTEAVLQHEYGVSRVTVRTALKRLEEDGLISTHQGRGAFVTSQSANNSRIVRNPANLLSFEDDLMRQAGPPTIELLSVESYPATAVLAEMLEVAEGTELLRVRRLGSVGGSPLWLETRNLHPDYESFIDDEHLQSPSVTALLGSLTGRHIESSRLRISAAAATAEQARHLGLNPGDPVLLNEFTVRADGRPLEAARAVFRGDRYAFAVEVFASALGTAGASGLGFPNGGLESRFRQEVTT